MSRITEVADEAFPNQCLLYMANTRRCLGGRRGQKALRALTEALEAMPVKELHASVFVKQTGEVCALGAFAVARRMDKYGETREMACAALAGVDTHDTADVVASMGIPSLVAWDIIFQNDEVCWNDRMSPAERYNRVLAYVQATIAHDAR